MNALALQTGELLRLAQNIWVQRIILAINLLLIVWIVWLFATLTWSLISEPPPLEFVPVPAQTQTVHVNTRAEKRLVSQLPAWHLLGQVMKEQEAPEKSGVPLDAPDTQLKLVLRGVLASDDDPGLVLAIISDPHGSEEMYAIGDTLTGNAKLLEVHPDRVIMIRGGRYEALRLPRDNATGQLEGAGATRRSRSVAPATSTARRQPSTGQSPRGKPKSLAQLVNIKRKKGAAGEDIGYTLHPGTDSDLFEQVGLRDGDVLTRINGINTDTAASVWRGLQSPKSGEPVTLTVLRGDQEATLTFKLPE